MKIQWPAVALTLGIYVVTVSVFLISDRFAYCHGADDSGNSLLIFLAAAVVIGIFFLRSIYQAITVHRSYWLIVGLHVVCILVFMNVFML